MISITLVKAINEIYFLSVECNKLENKLPLMGKLGACALKVLLFFVFFLCVPLSAWLLAACQVARMSAV